MAVGLGLPLLYSRLVTRTELLPRDNWGLVTGVSVAAVLVGGVVALLPGAPSVPIAVPGFEELVLALFTAAGLFSIGTVFGVATLRLPLDHFPRTISTGGRAHMNPPGVAGAFALVAVAGVGEQLLFRGVVQPAVAAQLGTGVGVGVAALANCLYYYPAVEDWPRRLDLDGFSRLAITAMGAALLGGAYVVAGNLLAPVIAHWLYLSTLVAIRRQVTRADG